MSDEKKATEKTVDEVKTNASETVAVQTAAKGSASKKASVKKTTAKNSVSEKATRRTRTAGGKTTKTAVAEKEKKTRTKKAAEPSIDDVTTALWKKFKDADVSEIQTTVAIQIIVYDLGTFFIAIKEGGEKHIIQAVYNDRDGTAEMSYDEILKAAKGGYNFLEAVKSGKVNYQGDLNKALILINLFA